MPTADAVPANSQMSKRRKRPPKIEAMAPGDVYEYSLTAELKTRKGTFWVRSGGATVIREGETTNAARNRMKDFIAQCIAEDAQEVIES